MNLKGYKKPDKNIDTETGIKETNERRINELINLVEKYIRTERHLEQHSDIIELGQMKHTLEIQDQRQDNINHLKDLLVNGSSNHDDFKNLQRNYHYTHNYLRHHEGHMDKKTLNATKEKQKHRSDQLKYLH